ncbi:hypothetical protein CcaCcLH18_01240 [Colletotrichum camelliae]|nr:hypothetical protein CcaCcLH18_01240 [Colletotrichum camelliae]
MKMMRSLVANLRGTTPDPIPVIRFRRDLVSHSAGSIPTGYDTSWQAGRLENHSSNRLAPTSPRAAAGDHGAPPAFGPLLPPPANRRDRPDDGGADGAPAASARIGSSGARWAPVPHFIPGVEFNLDALRLEEQSGLRFALQRRTFCSRCLAGGKKERQASTGIYPLYSCQAPEVTCNPPRIAGAAAGELRLEWKAPVHMLSSGEVIAKELAHPQSPQVIRSTTFGIAVYTRLIRFGKTHDRVLLAPVCLLQAAIGDGAGGPQE